MEKRGRGIKRITEEIKGIREREESNKRRQREQMNRRQRKQADRKKNRKNRWIKWENTDNRRLEGRTDEQEEIQREKRLIKG